MKEHQAKEPVQILAHNRVKQYILKEGTPVPFLVDLGVMNKEGKIHRPAYDKFKQINRFLEFIEDILPALSREREVTILDFGCGKSYLTFAMYYYLKELKKYDVHIIGLDLKEDVIRAVKTGRSRSGEALKEMTDAIHGHLTLEKLLYPDGFDAKEGV